MSNYYETLCETLTQELIEAREDAADLYSELIELRQISRAIKNHQELEKREFTKNPWRGRFE